MPAGARLYIASESDGGASFPAETTPSGFAGNRQRFPGGKSARYEFADGKLHSVPTYTPSGTDCKSEGLCLSDTSPKRVSERPNRDTVSIKVI